MDCSGTKLSSDRYWVVNLTMLWISQLLVLAGFAAMMPFIPLFIEHELQVYDKGKLAFYVAMFNFFGTAGYAIFNPIWGWLSDRFGVKPMLLRGTFLTCFLFPVMAYVSGPWMLILIRFATAACAGTTAASQTMIVRTTPEYRQGFALGTLTTSIWGGTMLGTVIGGFIIHYYSYKHAFWFCGILYFIAGFAILFTRDDKSRIAFNPGQTKQVRLYKHFPEFTSQVWTMFLLFLLFGLVRNLEIPYIALQIETLVGKDKAAYWTGFVGAMVCAGAIISGVIAGFLVDRVSAKAIVIPAALFSVVALCGQGFAPNIWFFAVCRTMLYVAAGGLQPVLQKTLSIVTPKRKRGSVFGVATSMSSFGGMLAALIGGYVMMALDVRGVFFFSAAAFLIVLPFMINMLNYAMHRDNFRKIAKIARKYRHI